MSHKKEFAAFCKKASNNQLMEIIKKEHEANRYSDRNIAEFEAGQRGYLEDDIIIARHSGSTLFPK